MLKHLLIWLLMMVYVSVLAQEHFVVMGEIRDNDNYQAIENAHIVNLKTRKGTISNKNGIFWISVEPKDYIKISVLGYHSQYFQIDSSEKDTLNIKLSRKIFELETVTVYPWTKEEFRYKFVNDKIKTDSIERLRIAINISADELENLAKNASMDRVRKNNPGTIGVGIPIFSNYKSKKEKQILGLIELEKWKDAREEYWKLAETISGYQGEKLNYFIRYCNFSKNYIVNARDYFLALNLKRKKLEFERFITKKP